MESARLRGGEPLDGVGGAGGGGKLVSTSRCFALEDERIEESDLRIGNGHNSQERYGENLPTHQA